MPDKPAETGSSSAQERAVPPPAMSIKSDRSSNLVLDFASDFAIPSSQLVLLVKSQSTTWYLHAPRGKFRNNLPSFYAWIDAAYPFLSRKTRVGVVPRPKDIHD